MQAVAAGEGMGIETKADAAAARRFRAKMV
jgi:hypothetical protein